MYYCGFTYTEAYKLPVYIRTWFVNRVTQELNRTNENGDPVGTPKHLPPEQALLLGRNNPIAPSRNARHT